MDELGGIFSDVGTWVSDTWDGFAEWNSDWYNQYFGSDAIAAGDMGHGEFGPSAELSADYAGPGVEFSQDYAGSGVFGPDESLAAAGDAGNGLYGPAASLAAGAAKSGIGSTLASGASALGKAALGAAATTASNLAKGNTAGAAGAAGANGATVSNGSSPNSRFNSGKIEAAKTAGADPSKIWTDMFIRGGK